MNTESSASYWPGFRIQSNLARSSRLVLGQRGDHRISAAEVSILLVAGALAALAVALVHLQVRIPGHAILRAVLPMAAGLALVPRRSAGMVMASGAAITVGLLSITGIGMVPQAAFLSVLALGPILDVALVGHPTGWRLYARFAAAGAATNLLAYVLKILAVNLGWSAAGGRQFAEFGSLALISFVVCGVVAGLISAVICFRSPSNNT